MIQMSLLWCSRTAIFYTLPVAFLLVVVSIGNTAPAPAGAASGAGTNVQPRPAGQPPRVDFQALLKEAGLEMIPTKSLRPIEVPRSDLYGFERASIHVSKPLEVRYAVRPISRIEIDYSDPHGSAPQPDHVYPLVFQSLIGQLARQGAMPTRQYKKQKAGRLFNADWAAAALFDTDPALNTKYRMALLLAIHKSRRGDAYSLFLFDDPRAVKPELDSLMARLRFVGDKPAK